MAKSYDHLFKVVLVGDCDTGKAALIWTFCEQGMPAALFVPTIGVDFMIRVIEINSKKIKLQIWDTAGQERFRTITASYYRGASGILMVYDITRRETFESIRSWKSHIDEHKHKDVVVILVGNKCHLENQRQVSIEEGKKLAEEFGIHFFETSSELAINVEQTFVTLADSIMAKKAIL